MPAPTALRLGGHFHSRIPRVSPVGGPEEARPDLRDAFRAWRGKDLEQSASRHEMESRWFCCGSWDVHWMLGQARVKTDPPRIPSFSPRELQRAADRASNLCPGVASNLGGRTSMPVVYACGRCGYSRAVGANEETGLPSERTRPRHAGGPPRWHPSHAGS